MDNSGSCEIVEYQTVDMSEKTGLESNLQPSQPTSIKSITTTANRSPTKRPNNEIAFNSSPAKKLRLELPKPKPKPSTTNVCERNGGHSKSHAKYIYGNYNRYYGYRNVKTVEDVRLVAFENYAHLFAGKEILDIGCNDGAVTIAIARKFPIKFITGIDIDRNLIGTARKHVVVEQKRAISNNNDKGANDATDFPNNIVFKQSNYVLSDDRLLELDEPHFDTILCLSVTKWIQLNFGDNGLKRAFKRMFKQLNPGGVLILETQNWKSYKRRKNLTPEINAHFKNIKLLPDKFGEYLMSTEIGFEKCFTMVLPAEHSVKGFQRPIQVYQKRLSADNGSAVESHVKKSAPEVNVKEKQNEKKN